MNATMKRPWWGVLCNKSPNITSIPYFVSGLILLITGLLTGPFAPMAQAIKVGAIIVGICAIIIGLILFNLCLNARFVIRFGQPFVIVSAKDGQKILNQPYHESSYWRWDPCFNHIVIEYGESWIKVYGRAAMTLRGENDKVAFITCDTTIRANPSSEQAIKIYEDCGDNNWPKMLEEWLEKQIEQFATTLQFDDYTKIEEKLKQFNTYDDDTIADTADFQWNRQFEGLGQKLRQYLDSHLKDDWSTRHPWLTINSIDYISIG